MPRKSSSRKQNENKKSASETARNTSASRVPTPAPATQDVERKVGQFSEAGKPPLMKK